jgi:hypothetical protein
MAAKAYKRLPGRGNGMLNATSLWEGDDHLLLVMSHRVSESYKRFLYRDIQAIVICQTRTSLITNIVLGAMGLMFSIPALLVLASNSELAIAFGIVAGLFFFLTLLNYFRGKSCRCTLRTAVQSHDLPSLGSLQNARKALARIQSKIVASQSVSQPQ